MCRRMMPAGLLRSPCSLRTQRGLLFCLPFFFHRQQSWQPPGSQDLKTLDFVYVFAGTHDDSPSTRIESITCVYAVSSPAFPTPSAGAGSKAAQKNAVLSSLWCTQYLGKDERSVLLPESTAPSILLPMLFPLALVQDRFAREGREKNRKTFEHRTAKGVGNRTGQVSQFATFRAYGTEYTGRPCSGKHGDV
jgi:hypothetical protein